MADPKSVTIVVTIDHHMSGMGFSPIYSVEKGSSYYNGVPLPEGLDRSRGQRYRVTFERLDPDPEMGPRRNPWGRCAHSPMCKRGVYLDRETCGTREECRRERKAAQVERTLEV